MKVRTRAWWALVRGPGQLPVLFVSREDAEDNRDPDEHIVHVRVEAVNPKQRALKLPTTRRSS